MKEPYLYMIQSILCSGLFLAIHFVLWFESLRHTSVASSTTIVCTEVVWVCLGFPLGKFFCFQVFQFLFKIICYNKKGRGFGNKLWA